MELTRKQQEGLSIILARHRAHEKYTTVSGYARHWKVNPS